MTPIINEELKALLLEKEGQTEVFFDASGRHYLNVHSLVAAKGDKEKQLYGQGVFSHKEIIDHPLNVDNVKEDISKGEPSTLIVTTMTREEVLEAKIVDTNPNSLIGMLSNASDAEKAEALKALLPSNMLEALSKLVEAQSKPAETKVTTTAIPPKKP